MTLVTKLPVTFKLYVGTGDTQRVYSGEPSYILGIVRYLKDADSKMLYTVTQVTERLITIRTLQNRARKDG